MQSHNTESELSEASLESALKLSKDFADAYLSTYSNAFSKSCSIASEFHKTYTNEKAKLPYHLNVIDELHANENSHSRILVKLLKYKRDEKYPILESFLKFITDNCETFDFDTSLIKKPKIMHEAMRIDASIIDKQYAIIFENKIHSAPEQKDQVVRYYQIIQSKKITNIFIVYLTSSGGGPSEYSLSSELKKSLEENNHFAELSYSTHVLDWLQTCLLPNILYRERIMISAIEQYIDHLQGLFHIRKSENNMNEQLISNLGNFLELKDKPEFNLQVISNYKSYLDKTKIYLEKLCLNEHLNLWEFKIKSLFPNYEFIKSELNGYRHIGIIIDVPNIGSCSVLIEITRDERMVFGVSSLFTKQDLFPTELAKYLTDCFLKVPNPQKSTRWCFWSYVDSYDLLFDYYVRQVNTIIDKTNYI
ncbi:MAG TPA: PD-(D/E)XK nuclease family protein [Bacteroidales bacterium]|nr:PD-(D/E)XK nuclease family protein [Bacteroidales bacterium]